MSKSRIPIHTLPKFITVIFANKDLKVSKILLLLMPLGQTVTSSAELNFSAANPDSPPQTMHCFAHMSTKSDLAKHV